MPAILAAPIILTFSWSNISGGQLGVIASLFVIAGFFYRWAPGASAALETARASAESFQRLAESRAQQIEEMHAQHMSLNEAIDQAKADLDAAKQVIHDREKDILEREKTIAALNERPDTEAMKSHFDRGFQSLAEPLQELVGMHGDVMQLLRLTLDPERPPRSTDPK